MKTLTQAATGHLILNRRIGESITIGEDADIVIRVLNIVGKNNIQLVIEAPKELPVWREELFLKLKEKKDKSMQCLSKSTLSKSNI